MSKITTLIGRQSYELIRNRIGEILIDELANQTVLGNVFTSANVEVESSSIVDNTEMSTIQISLSTGDYSNEHQGTSNGEFEFNIDVFCKSKSSLTYNGSINAMFKTQALIGIVRYILKDPQYKTLGFTPGFIGGVTVGKIMMGDADKTDTMNSIGGRLIFKVKAIEENALLNVTLINSYRTSVILGTSAQGYQYNQVP